MLQELLMNGLHDQERKLSIPAPQLPNSTPSSSEAAPHEKLQCPRCNSTNTKFCYYNNYNLTQPRHFCKTCRRYWTKGGALRNVPIGGGCRKSKSSHKARPVMTSSDDIIGSDSSSSISKHIMPLGLGTYNSHLLDLFKGSSSNQLMQNPYNLNLSSGFNPFRMIKEETGDAGNYSYQKQMQKSKLLSDVPTSTGIQELYQRLQRSNNSSGLVYNGTSSANYSNNCASLALTSTVSRGNDCSLEQIPVHNGDLGSWNGTGMTWSDILASNGSFHL